MSCQEFGKYLLLENITPLLNGGFQQVLGTTAMLMIRSCKGRLDLYRGTLISRELSVSSTWYLIGARDDRTCILIHTGKAVTENKVLADTGRG